MRQFCGVIALGSLLMISACASAPDPQPETSSQPEPPPEPVVAKLKPAVPEPKPEIITPKMTEVIGWDRENLSKLFGGANLVRRDLGAEIWQYRAPDCVLLIFLYPKKNSTKPDDLVVTHIDVSGGDTADRCIHSVVKSYRSETG